MTNKPDLAVCVLEEVWHCVLQDIHKSISRRVSCQSDTPMVHITYGTA